MHVHAQTTDVVPIGAAQSQESELWTCQVRESDARRSLPKRAQGFLQTRCFVWTADAVVSLVIMLAPLANDVHCGWEDGGFSPRGFVIDGPSPLIGHHVGTLGASDPHPTYATRRHARNNSVTPILRMFRDVRNDPKTQNHQNKRPANHPVITRVIPPPLPNKNNTSHYTRTNNKYFADVFVICW